MTPSCPTSWINQIHQIRSQPITKYLSPELLKIVTIVGARPQFIKADEVDLVILNTAPLLLRMRVLQKKTLLADNDPFARHAYESATIRSYLDFSKIEKFILTKRYLHG